MTKCFFIQQGPTLREVRTNYLSMLVVQLNMLGTTSNTSRTGFVDSPPLEMETGAQATTSNTSRASPGQQLAETNSSDSQLQTNQSRTGRRRILWEDESAEGSAQPNKRHRPVPAKSAPCTECGCKQPLKHRIGCSKFVRGRKNHSGLFSKRTPDPESEQDAEETPETPAVLQEERPETPSLLMEMEPIDLNAALEGPVRDLLARVDAQLAGQIEEAVFQPSPQLIPDEVS